MTTAAPQHPISARNLPMVRHTASQWHLPKPDSGTSATLKIIGTSFYNIEHMRNF